VTPNLFIARNVFLTGSTEIFLQNFMRNNLEKQKKGQLKIIVSAVLVLCVFVGVVIAVSNDGYEKSQVFYDDEQVDVYHKIVQEQGDTVFYEILVNDEIIHTTAKKGETLDLMNILDDLFADEIIPEEPVPETQSEEIVLDNQKPAKVEVKKEAKLAEIVNGKNWTTDTYAKKYVEKRKNYTNIDFEEMKPNQKTSANFITRNKRIKGVISENEKYAIELVDCDRNAKKCAFRVNGVHAGFLSTQSGNDEIILKDGHKAKIKSIKFNTCGNVRFCDYIYEAYDEVEVEIE